MWAGICFCIKGLYTFSRCLLHFYFYFWPLSLLNCKYNVQDFSNKMFILLYFKKKVSLISFCHQDSIQVPIKMNFLFLQEKRNSKNEEIEWPELNPCLYKRRWAMNRMLESVDLWAWPLNMSNMFSESARCFWYCLRVKNQYEGVPDSGDSEIEEQQFEFFILPFQALKCFGNCCYRSRSILKQVANYACLRVI